MVQLGAEIGKAEGRNVRHRMFTIVDRSNLNVDLPSGNPGVPPIYVSGDSGFISGGSNATVAMPTGYMPNPANPVISGTYEDTNWSITLGSQILVDANTPYQEVVTIPNNAAMIQPGVGTNPPTFTAPFVNNHPGPITITFPTAVDAATNKPIGSPGNPGPQPGFDPRKAPGLVRYFNVIQ